MINTVAELFEIVVPRDAENHPDGHYNGLMSSGDLVIPPSKQSAPQQAVLYVDESGNSGPNYLDQSQPFYVLAGWLVPDRGNEEAWVAVEEMRQRLSPQAGELKSAVLLKGERQKREAAELFRRYGGLGAIPLYLIAEKRFCVAGKIVETFLDPAYNPILRNGITSDRETKQEIANLLYERLPEPSLVRFAQAYRDPSPKSLQLALHDVAENAREHLNPELADALLGSLGNIEEIAEAEAATSPFGNVGASLNMPCLVSFLMMAEGMGRVGLHRPIRIVHDRQHAYEAGYQKIFELHKGIPRLFAPLPGDDEIQFGGLEAVAEFETADSEHRLPIQAADVLAGVINHLMRLAMTGTDPTEADIELARLTLPGLLVHDVKIAWPIWSDECIGRVGQSLIINAIRPTPKSEEEIQKLKAVAEAKSTPALPALKGSSKSGHAYKLPCPVFAIRGVESGGVMILTPTEEDILESDGVAQPMVPLFSSTDTANGFLSMFTELTEPQQVVAFDGPEIAELVEALDACSEYSEMIVFDPGTESMQHMYMPAFVEGLRAIFRRIERLLRTGLDRVVLQRTQVNGREAMSMLLADGRYGAMWAPVGEVVVGATREEALDRLKKQSALPPTQSQKPEVPQV
ncbi:MAG: DUF3800 domain-containing protein [Phycisphaerales bacterium]